METDDQDDAFHRWLTSTDTNSKNYFSLNESANAAGNGVGMDRFDGFNSDYNGEERNYENIGFDNEARLPTSSATGDTSETMNAIAPGATKNIEAAAALIYNKDVKANGIHENKKHFFENNGNNMASSNGIINNNNNISPFSQTYDVNINRNNILFGSNTKGIRGGGGGDDVDIIGSTVSNEDNGVANVVNIDIMLTASSAELQQQQAINRQQQQGHFALEQQIGKAPDKFMQPPPSVLISNTSVISAIDVDAPAPIAVLKNNTLSSKLNGNSSRSSNTGGNKQNFTNIAGGGGSVSQNSKIQLLGGVNLSNNNNNSYTNNYNRNNNNNNNNSSDSAISYSSSNSTDSFKFEHLPTVLVSQTNATSTTSTATALAASVITPTLSTTSSPERQCNVMGKYESFSNIIFCRYSFCSCCSWSCSCLNKFSNLWMGRLWFLLPSQFYSMKYN